MESGRKPPSSDPEPANAKSEYVDKVEESVLNEMRRVQRKRARDYSRGLSLSTALAALASGVAAAAGAASVGGLTTLAAPAIAIGGTVALLAAIAVRVAEDRGKVESRRDPGPQELIRAYEHNVDSVRASISVAERQAVSASK